MDFTADKLRSLVRKWQTLIEAHVDIKTTDGYLLRMFCIGFTKKRQGQVKKTCYAQTSQIRQIRKKMTEIMVRESSNCDLKDLVSKFIPEAIGAPGRCLCAAPDHQRYQSTAALALSQAHTAAMHTLESLRGSTHIAVIS